MLFRLLTITFLTLALPLAVKADQKNLTASEPNAVLNAMQAFGYVGVLEAQPDGDPVIVSRVSNSDFLVLFYGCTENIDCGSIQFWAAFERDRPISALEMNNWNYDMRFTRAFIDDDGTAILEMDVNLYFDGSGPQNFSALLNPALFIQINR